jgi:hypothetical protein
MYGYADYDGKTKHYEGYIDHQLCERSKHYKNHVHDDAYAGYSNDERHKHNASDVHVCAHYADCDWYNESYKHSESDIHVDAPCCKRDQRLPHGNTFGKNATEVLAQNIHPSTCISSPATIGSNGR